jgi:hypothetical protein
LTAIKGEVARRRPLTCAISGRYDNAVTKLDGFARACVIVLFLVVAAPLAVPGKAEGKRTRKELDLQVPEERRIDGFEASGTEIRLDSYQLLKAHNRWRARYDIAPLKWSPKLARYAQEWAETLLREERFAHRSSCPYGENLATATGLQLTCDEVVDLWAGEGSNYDRKTNSCAQGEVCGHFTQIVWKNTREVGCGMARKGDREVWVCNYTPPGNVIGRAPY